MIIFLNAYICEMDKKVRNGYEFRASFVDRNNFKKEGEFFIHAGTFNQLKQKINNLLKTNKNLRIKKEFYGKRIKKASFKPCAKNCSGFSRGQVHSLKTIFKAQEKLELQAA